MHKRPLHPKTQAVTVKIQRLLDVCHAAGARPGRCGCQDFHSVGECEHTAILARYEGLYQQIEVQTGFQPFGFKKAAHAVTVQRFKADSEAVSQRLYAKEAKQAEQKPGFRITASLGAETFSTAKGQGVRLVINGQTVIDINPVHDGTVEFIEMGHDLVPSRKLDAEELVRIIQGQPVQEAEPEQAAPQQEAPAKAQGYRLTMRDSELSYSEWSAKYTPPQYPPAGIELARKAIEATRQARERGLKEEYIQRGLTWIASDIDNAEALAKHGTDVVEGYIRRLSLEIQREERLGRIAPIKVEEKAHV